ncbi:MAG: ribonuclease HII [Ruminococcaceae bacterium]|nr:ribonuclease HII [Oscillospiraceae bacterium]
MLDFTIETELMKEGYTAVCGVDEAGRGPLCGPVFAAACILPHDYHPEELNDSKKLTPKKRERLFDEIREHALAYCIASASVEEIDEMNILEADLLAMRRAIDGLSVKADFALIDGNIARDFQIPARAVIGGDALSPSIAAASILAKVARDRECIELDRLYPQYGIAKHKGYGTKVHMDALRTYGPSPIHRKQFIRFLNKDENAENTK